MATLSDAELIALSVEDARAFDVVFRRHYPAISRRDVIASTGSRADGQRTELPQ